MKRLFALIITVLIFVSAALPCAASEAEASKGTTSQRIFDEADLVSAYDEAEIESKIAKLEKKANVPVVIWTVPEVISHDNDFSAEACWQFLYSLNLIDESEECPGAIILLVQYPGVMGENEFDIYAFGQVQSKMTDYRIDTILDAIEYDFGEHNFTEAFNKFVKKTQKKLVRSVSAGWTIFSAIAAALAGILTKTAKKEEYKLSGTAYSYNVGEKSKVDLKEQANVLIGENTTRTYISTSSGSGSRGGGSHTSSGGHSYSGGGRRF